MPRGGAWAHSTETPSGGRPLPPTLPWELEDGGGSWQGAGGFLGRRHQLGRNVTPAGDAPTLNGPAPTRAEAGTGTAGRQPAWRRDIM